MALYAALSTWSVSYRCAPWSLNQERKNHWSWRNERVEEWRQAFAWLALEAKIPPCEAIAVTVHVQAPGVRQDIGNAYPAAKAGIDGLVDAGVIVDDTPDHLRLLSFTPPTHDRVPRTTLVIERLE